MALYEFQSSDGQIILIERPMRHAPKLGAVVTVNGKQYKRIISTSANNGGSMLIGACDASAYPKISSTLPQFAAGAEFVTKPGKDFGKPIITSRRHQDELCKRHGFTREYHHTDLKQIEKREMAAKQAARAAFAKHLAKQIHG